LRPNSTVLRKNCRAGSKRTKLRQFGGRTSTIKGPRSTMNSSLCWLTIFGDMLRLLVLALRSKSSLAAENLFLRKQLAFYRERKIKPRRADNPTRFTLVWLGRWFDWRSALAVVTLKTFIGWHRKGFQLFWRWKCQAGRPRVQLCGTRCLIVAEFLRTTDR